MINKYFKLDINLKNNINYVESVQIDQNLFDKFKEHGLIIKLQNEEYLKTHFHLLFSIESINYEGSIDLNQHTFIKSFIIENQLDFPDIMDLFFDSNKFQLIIDFCHK